MKKYTMTWFYKGDIFCGGTDVGESDGVSMIEVHYM
jgi:hypothetical protein